MILDSDSDGFKRSEELEKAVDEWNDQDLARLLFTLARTIASKQRKAGWTDADLRWRAGLSQMRNAERGTKKAECRRRQRRKWRRRIARFERKSER